MRITESVIDKERVVLSMQRSDFSSDCNVRRSQAFTARTLNTYLNCNGNMVIRSISS